MITDAQLIAALERIVSACVPLDMWLGGEWVEPPSNDERHEFVLALATAMALLHQRAYHVPERREPEEKPKCRYCERPATIEGKCDDCEAETYRP